MQFNKLLQLMVVVGLFGDDRYYTSDIVPY